MTIFGTRGGNSAGSGIPVLRTLAVATSCAAGMFLSPAALAYVGPGAGIGVVGIVLAILAAIVVTIVGLVAWPIRMIFRRRKPETPDPGNQKTEPAAPTDRDVQIDDRNSQPKAAGDS